MEVAIVGASGFVGRHLCAHLRSCGHRSVALLRGARATDADREVVLDRLTDPSSLSRALEGVDALVNLAGLKRGSPEAMTQAHITTPAALCEAALRAGVPRLVHISVAGCRPGGPASSYMATKWRGEAIVRESGVAATILRPGVIYGAGDDLLRNLAAMIRHSPIFPAPRGGTSRLQPVAVADVCEAIVASLAQEIAVGATYDIVSAAEIEVRALVHRVAEALALPVWVVPAPLPLMRPAAALMERLLRDPPITRAQLSLLSEGVTGDPEPARRDLGIAPRPVDRATLEALCADVPPWLGVSLRPLSIADTDGIRAAARHLRRAAALSPLFVGLPIALSLALDDLWAAMPTSYALLLPLALIALPLPYRRRLRPSPRAALTGVAAAALLYGLGAAVVALLSRVDPAAATALTELEFVAAGGPGAWMAPLLVLTVVGEELVFRTALLLPLASRLGPWLAIVVCALLYTLAHAAAGPPLLLVAAAGAGLFWGYLHIRTGSLLATILCHLLWDVAVIALAPYSLTAA